MTPHPDGVHPHRRVFCNRTLHLSGVRAIGYDLDYTLVHYHVREWEGRAYAHVRRALAERGWPVAELAFDPDLVVRGLVVDKDRGNLLKVDRFGYVKAVAHGARRLPWAEARADYARTVVDLSDARFEFANTLFSLSEACMYAQLVPLLDEGRLPPGTSYRGLWDAVGHALNRTHVEGELKAEIQADPARFVVPDPELPATLLDQKRAGKKLVVVTNSDWSYTRAMLDHAVNPGLPAGTTWRDLFDLVVVSARKPAFFSERAPMFRLVDERGLLEPLVGPPTAPAICLGGHAALVEAALDVRGEELLYVGDHVFSDVNVSKKTQRWRTALVLRELEEELLAVDAEQETQRWIGRRMVEKGRLEQRAATARLALLRAAHAGAPGAADPALATEVEVCRQAIEAIDAELSPVLARGGRGFNARWGLMLRAGNDKSHLTRQIERHADLYTSRVSNLLPYTPFASFRAPRGSLPHDPVGE